jgi:hypothetical protein
MGLPHPQAKTGQFRKQRQRGDAQGAVPGLQPNAITDAYYQLPLHIALRPANENEGTHFAEDLDATLARHPWIKPKVIMADKGYDALPNFRHAVKRRIIPNNRRAAATKRQKDRGTPVRRTI